MSSTIGNLTSGAPAQSTDVLPIQRGSSNNYKLAVSDVLAAISSVPNGTTATTQAPLSDDTKVATDAYVDAAVTVETSRAETAEGLLVPKTTTVNGHALSSNVTVSASDLTTGSLPNAQLPSAYDSGISGFWWGSGSPVMPPGSVSTTTGFSATSGYFYFIYLDRPTTISKATLYFSSVSGTSTMAVGIYPASAGSSLAFSASWNTSTGQATGIRAGTASGTVTLPAGWYYVTMTLSNASIGISYVELGILVAQLAVINTNGTRMGTYTPGTPGVADAILPALTANTTLNSFGPTCWFE